jgi:hypothetical protein
MIESQFSKLRALHDCLVATHVYMLKSRYILKSLLGVTTNG